MTTKFFEQTISSANGGFGEFQANPINGEGWADDWDLAQEMAQGAAGELLELGTDALPAGVEDIRGRIHNEPARVFVMVYADGHVSYTGVTSYEVV